MTTGKQVFSTITSAGQLELSIADVEIPTPGPDDVVVRIDAAPINPSDMGPLFGPASIDKANLEDTKLVAPVPENRLGMVAARLDQTLPVAMNVPARLSPPVTAKRPEHSTASSYPSCRALPSRNMLVCRRQLASFTMMKPHRNVRLRLSSTR